MRQSRKRESERDRESDDRVKSALGESEAGEFKQDLSTRSRARIVPPLTPLTSSLKIKPKETIPKKQIKPSVIWKYVAAALLDLQEMHEPSLERP